MQVCADLCRYNGYQPHTSTRIMLVPYLRDRNQIHVGALVHPDNSTNTILVISPDLIGINYSTQQQIN